MMVPSPLQHTPVLWIMPHSIAMGNQLFTKKTACSGDRAGLMFQQSGAQDLRASGTCAAVSGTQRS
jgi:hypothetical protein